MRQRSEDVRIHKPDIFFKCLTADECLVFDTFTRHQIGVFKQLLDTPHEKRDEWIFESPVFKRKYVKSLPVSIQLLRIDLGESEFYSKLV